MCDFDLHSFNNGFKSCVPLSQIMGKGSRRLAQIKGAETTTLSINEKLMFLRVCCE